MLRSELLEREAEARRIELAETFDELRARATPGHVINQLVDYATDSRGADFFRNLRDQTVANPLALGLVGAGLVWLMLSSGRDSRQPYGTPPTRGRMRSYFGSTRERVGSAMSDARERAGGAMSDARERVADAAHRTSEAAGSIAGTARNAKDAALETASQWRDAAGSAASSLRDASSSTYGYARSRVGDTTAALGSAVSQSAGWTTSGVRSFASGTAATGRDIVDFCRDQPLVLAGLGVALGAVMGAAFPSTETERQLMGETSDDLKEQTRAFATEHYERSRSAAGEVIDEVQKRVRGGQEALSGHPSIVPSDFEEDITETKETIRPERAGLRDGRS